MSDTINEESRGYGADAPNQQNVRPDGSGPADEGTGGSTWPPDSPGTTAGPNQVDENDLPGRHAGLDEIAAARGYTWSRDDLTVAEKKAELAEGGE